MFPTIKSSTQPQAVKPAASQGPTIGALAVFAGIVGSVLLLVSVGKFLSGTAATSNYLQHTRFQVDNAVGATANAVEAIRDQNDFGTITFACALLAFVLVALERVRAAVIWQTEVMRALADWHARMTRQSPPKQND
jgi:hypothetical protein